MILVMSDLQIVQQNIPFLGSIYNFHVLGFLGIFLMVIVVWELIWKAFALWRAARLKNLTWFIVLITVNSAGILPIIYLLSSRKKYHQLVVLDELQETKNIIAEVEAEKNS